MGSKMKIRKGKISDLNELFNLLDSTPELQAHEEGGTYTKKWVKAVLTSKKRNLVLIAEENGKIAGFIIAHYLTDVEESILSDIYVKADYRRKGIATKLLREYERISKKNNIKDVTELVLVTNKKMQQFTEKHGYRKDRKSVV